MANLFNIDISQISHDGREVLLMMLNGDILYEKETFRVEYTVRPVDEWIDQVNISTGRCAGLPTIYTDEDTWGYGYTKIEIIKTDGTKIYNTNAKCNEIAKVIVWYPKDTYKIRFISRTNDESTSVVKEINYCNTSNFDNMSDMFSNCPHLSMIKNTNKWKTKFSTNMNRMFLNCYSLTELDLSGWDTSNVTDMAHMFDDCYSLNTVGDISNWDTGNVTDMTEMFYYCDNLTSLDLSNWNTSSVTDMTNMFYKCSSLTELDVSNWDTGNITSMYGMFNSCESLTSLDLSKWNTSHTTQMSEMFANCTSLAELDLSNFKMTTYGCSNMFLNCTSLHTLRLDKCDGETINKFITSEGFPTNEIDGITRTIYCRESQITDISKPDNWEFSFVYEEPEEPVTRPLYVVDQFKGDTKITNVDVLVDTSHTDLSYMFSGCTKLVSVNTEGWDTYNVTNMNGMFYNCRYLPEFNMSNFSCPVWLVSTGRMFMNCKSLTSLDASKADIATNFAAYMFSGCNQLVTLDLSGISMNRCDSATDMFSGCSALVNFVAPKNINTSIDFSDCKELSHESLMSIVNNLASSWQSELTLWYMSYYRLTDEERAIATNKGWIIRVKNEYGTV